ncbi:hypothetical protein QJQ45_028764, partial [Haematococcus lacustris]
MIRDHVAGTRRRFDYQGISASPLLLAQQLGTDIKAGLACSPTTGEPLDAEQRLACFGANRLPDPASVSLWQYVVEALEDTTIRALLAAGLFSLLLSLYSDDPSGGGSDWVEGAAILTSAAIVVGVGSVTNYQKEAKFRDLNLVKDNVMVRVVRAGVERSISTFELLVGDVLVLETGDIVAADGLLVLGEEL